MQPTIAIVGGAESRSDYPDPVRDPQTALAAATEIGHELAALGCPIVVFSAKADFIEQAVVAGYVASGRAKPRSIAVVGRYGSDTQFAEYAADPDLFVVRPESTDDWEVSFYRSLLGVDGILLIGGGRSTFAAGIIALSRQIAVAPVAAFGGAAERVWHRFNSNRGPVSEDDVAVLARSWRAGMASTVAGSLLSQYGDSLQRKTAAERAGRSARRRTAAGLVSAFAVLLLALLTIPLAYAASAGTWRDISVLVAAPLLASTCGALVRNAYDGSGQWLRATVLGCAAGTVAFLLFVAAQLATNPELLDGGGVRRLIVFVLAIGFVGGFTSETVYHKLRDRDVVDSGLARPSAGGSASE